MPLLHLISYSIQPGKVDAAEQEVVAARSLDKVALPNSGRDEMPRFTCVKVHEGASMIYST